MKQTRAIVPETVGLIMDGNGRWAKKQNGHRTEGHTKGIYHMISLVAHAFERGVKSVVCYGLSTENLSRPREEVEHIHRLMIEVFDFFVEKFTAIGACVRYIGKLDALPDVVRDSMQRAERALERFAQNGKTLYVAVAYGSRHEIVEAINAAVERGQRVSEESFLAMLSMPLEPDLIIRTGGEKRLSNFLLYQASYSELYFSSKLFPDFSAEDFDRALSWYGRRKRRFGGLQNK